MTCHHCSKPIESGRYCNDDCKADHFNNIMLLYQPDLTGHETAEEANLIQAHVRIGLTRLIKDMSLEEIIARGDLFTYIAAEIKSLVWSDMSRHALAQNVKRDTEGKVKTRQYVDERDSSAVKNSVLERAQAAEKREIKQSGEKISKTGTCAWCGAASLAKFCKDKADCKTKGILLETFLKNLPGMTEKAAREAIGKMGGS